MLAAALLIMAVSGIAAPVLAGRPTMLDRPAVPGPEAARQMLTAATWAGKRIVAVGRGGAVVYSDDQGATWRPARKVPTSAMLTAVAFADDRVGWAVGHLGVVLRSIDGGVTWERQLDGVQAAQLALADAERRAAAQASEQAQGAVKAARFLVEDGPNKPLLTLVVQSAREVEVAGAFGLVFATSDGGVTWEPESARFDNARGMHLYAAARSGNDLVYVGEQGTVLRGPADGLLKTVATPYPGTMFGVLAIRGGRLLAHGLRGNALLSEDGGLTWRQVATGMPASIQAGAVLDDGAVLLASETGQLVASRDGGRTFKGLSRTVQPAAALFPLPGRTVLVLGPRGAERIDLSAEQELK
ncbi:WD40/YVTN/BNR-like repeat-containing protein [Pseudoduganella dura]|nr:hypothetical protein [Pseudoduganella dura]